MEIQGTVIKILQPRTGTSQRTGKQWMTQSFLIEVRTGEHGQYTRKVMFSMFGEDNIKKAQLFEGKNVVVGFDIEAKESTQKPGQWFNDVRAYSVAPVVTQQPAYTPPRQPQPMPQGGYYQPQQQPYQPQPSPYQPQQPYQGQQQQGDLPF